jgi:hypothetical protein
MPKESGSKARERPGATSLPLQLNNTGVPWYIVTSYTQGLLFAWLRCSAYLSLITPRRLKIWRLGSPIQRATSLLGSAFERTRICQSWW